MAIDPRNYDLDELRGVTTPDPEGPTVSTDVGGETAFVWGPTRAEEPRDDATPDESATPRPKPAAAARFEARLFRDLAAMDMDGPDARPYLDALPASLPAELLVVEWVEFLVAQAGRGDAEGALDFYASVGWVSESAAAKLRAYLPGVDDARANPANELDADDHRVSLHYVARLASLSRN